MSNLSNSNSQKVDPYGVNHNSQVVGFRKQMIAYGPRISCYACLPFRIKVLRVFPQFWVHVHSETGRGKDHAFRYLDAFDFEIVDGNSIKPSNRNNKWN